MKTLSKEEIGKLKQQVRGKDIYFMFIPSPQLCEAIIQNQHPYIQKLPAPFKDIMIDQKAIRLDGEMIIKYLEGTLDAGNIFILDQGEVRVIDNSYVIKRKD